MAIHSDKPLITVNSSQLTINNTKRTKSIVNCQLSIVRGYTLIELLVVISILTSVLGFAIASFSSTLKTQTVASAASDVLTMLSKARSRSVSQVKPDSCATSTLDGYKVSIIPTNTYQLDVVCNGVSSTLETKTLPINVTFQTSTTSAYLFRVLTGGVDGAPAGGSAIILTSGSYTKTITIYPNGRIFH